MAGQKSRLRVAKRLDEVGFSEIVQVRNRVMELRASCTDFMAANRSSRPQTRSKTR
jgi:hypothetical protein